MSQSITLSSQRHKDVHFILKDLLKVIKVVAMYPEGNPLPHSLRRSFAEKLVSLVEQHGELKFNIDRNALTFHDEAVYVDSSKEEALAALFFNAGFSSIVFKDGLDVPEVYKLLEVLKTYQNCKDRSLDLANLLWEASLSRFSFTTIEDIALSAYSGDFQVLEIKDAGDRTDSSSGSRSKDGVFDYAALFSSDSNAPTLNVEEDSDSDQRPGQNYHPGSSRGRHESPGGIFYAVIPEGQTGIAQPSDGVDQDLMHLSDAAKAMGFSDLTAQAMAVPDTTFILNDSLKLSEEQERTIAAILERDARFDMYDSTIELLKEMLHQESEMTDFWETVAITEKVMQEFVHSGQLNEAGRILRYFTELEGELRGQRPLWAVRLKDARLSSGSRERLRNLVAACNNDKDLGAADFRRYLDHFGWEALGAIADMLGDLDHRIHREALCDYLATVGKDYVEIVAKGIYDKRWYVVRNSVIILSRIDDKRAISHLRRAATHEDVRVRRELIAALMNATGDEALDILRTAVGDSDPDIRQQAIRSIISHNNESALDTMTELINEERFVTAGETDQQELLTGYSILGGDKALPYLLQLISRYNFFHDPQLAFFRRAAFRALVENPSNETDVLLVKLSSNLRRDIRAQAVEVKRQRRERRLKSDHGNFNS